MEEVELTGSSFVLFALGALLAFMLAVLIYLAWKLWLGAFVIGAGLFGVGAGLAWLWNKAAPVVTRLQAMYNAPNLPRS